MSIFKSEEGEMARFDRHMKPIRLLNENRRLRMNQRRTEKRIADSKKTAQSETQRARNFRATIKIISTSTIRATSETLAISGFQAGGAKKPEGGSRGCFLNVECFSFS